MTDQTAVAVNGDTFDSSTAAGRLRILWGATADPQLAMSDDEVADVATVLDEHAEMATELERLRAELEYHGVGKHYRPSRGGGLCVSCRRPMREGMLVVRATAPKCLLCTGEAAAELSEFPAAQDLRANKELHARCTHPAYEYATTQGPRKTWDGMNELPEGDGWERNVDAGRDGWERFDYHEESYWRRLSSEAKRRAVLDTAAPEAARGSGESADA